MLPDQHRDRADDHAGQSAIARHAPPKQRDQYQRAKGRTKARPGVADHAQHLGVGVLGDDDGNQGNGKHHGAAKPDQLLLAGLLVQKGFVDVLCERAGAHQQLARQGAHHGSQHGGQQHASNPWIEQEFGDFKEHVFAVGIHAGGQIRAAGKEGNAEKAHGHGTAKAQHHPRHADAAGAGDGLERLGRHETHQNMGLTEIAQTPCQQREDGNRAMALEHVKSAAACGFNDGGAGANAAVGVDHHQRGQNQRCNHQRGLNGVCPAHGQKAADEHIGHGGDGTHPQGGLVAHAEHALKQAGTGHHARGAVDGEEHQNHQCGHDAQQTALVFKTVGEVIGQR